MGKTNLRCHCIQTSSFMRALICSFYYHRLICSFIVLTAKEEAAQLFHPGSIHGSDLWSLAGQARLYQDTHSCCVLSSVFLSQRRQSLKISRSVHMRSTCTRTGPRPSAITAGRCCSGWSDRDSSVTVRGSKTLINKREQMLSLSDGYDLFFF